MPLDDTSRHRIQQIIDGHEVVLFMKGERDAPRCGFSATVVSLLDQLVADYHTEDVLADPALRDGIKEFSAWPTVPQLYVRGEFVGGCDIASELFADGELQKLLGSDPGEVARPRVEWSAEVAETLAAGLARTEGAGVARLLVDARYRARLVVSPAGENDFRIEQHGVTLHVDPLSAGRADGAQIDAEHGRRGTTLRVLLPQAPANTPGA